MSVMRSSRVRRKASAFEPSTTRPVSPDVDRYLKYFSCEGRSSAPVVGSKKVTAGHQTPAVGTFMFAGNSV